MNSGTLRSASSSATLATRSIARPRGWLCEQWGGPPRWRPSPLLRVVEVSVGEWPQRGAPRWLWWEPWSQIDFPAIRHSMQAAVEPGRFRCRVGVFDARRAIARGLECFCPNSGSSRTSRRHASSPRSARVAPTRPPRAALRAQVEVSAAIQTRGWRRVQKRACAQASLVTVCSEIDRTALGCKGRVVVVPNGYEVSREPAARLTRRSRENAGVPGHDDYRTKSGRGSVLRT